jgi:hypothetical protein
VTSVSSGVSFIYQSGSYLYIYTSSTSNAGSYPVSVTVDNTVTPITDSITVIIVYSCSVDQIISSSIIATTYYEVLDTSAPVFD